MNGIITITDSIRAVLESAVYPKTEQLQITSTLNRAEYVAVNNVLEALGGKWNRGEKAHVFTGNARDIVEAALNEGHAVDAKKARQFFPTPIAIAEQVAELATAQGDRELGRVLEPSAGDGALVDALRDEDQSLDGMDVCEIEPMHYDRLKSLGCRIVEQDFFKLNMSYQYRTIIANPPFDRRLDVKHVSKMLGHLLPGGRLVTVMSPAITFAADKATKALREELNRMGKWRLEEPNGDFKSSGTSVKTVILVFDKNWS